MNYQKTILKTVIVLFVLSISAFANNTGQYDWSGGDSVAGPVADWDNYFDMSTDINWLTSPGKLRLSSVLLGEPIEHFISSHSRLMYPNSLYTEDMDGDGDTDILLFRQDMIGWMPNLDGNGYFILWYTIEDNFAYLSTISPNDIDGDGDIDVVGGSSIDIWHPYYLRWWSNDNGEGTAWTARNIATTEPGSSFVSVYSADVDGDSDIDVLAACGQGDYIAWWENRRSGNRWRKHIIDGKFSGASLVYSVDIDGDGDMDVLGASREINEIAWWENKGTLETKWTKYTIEDNIDFPLSICAEDIDGDGDMDILGADSDPGKIIWWENTGNSGISWFKHIVSDFSYYVGSVCSADMDNDGDMDILGAASGYTLDCVKWWSNDNGSGTIWTERIIDDDFPGANSVCSSDFDGDGKMDVLGGSSNGSGNIAWWEVTEFASVGDLTSSIFDTKIDTGTNNLEWGQINWDGNFPIGTTVTVDVRASNDSGNMGTWTTVASQGDDLSAYIDDNTRYFQYKVSVATNDLSTSPTLNVIKVVWNTSGIGGNNPPIAFALCSVAPNPNEGSASVSFALPKSCEVELTLYDIKGRKVSTLVTGTYQPGKYSAEVSGLASGVYIYKLTADEHVSSKKMIVR